MTRSTFPFLTADDWGMSPAINAGILEIVELGGIGRISMMPCEQFMGHKLDQLKVVDGLRFGLHFNLTHHQDFASPGAFLKEWALGGKSNRKNLVITAQGQLLKQINTMRSYDLPVHYFDGHQHIHLVPGLFEELAFILKAEGISEVRVPYDPGLLLTRKFSISLFALALKPKVKNLGLKTLEFFYPQASHFKNPELLLTAMIKNKDKEILVHPSTHNDLSELGIPDDYREERVREYHCLKTIFSSSFRTKRF